MIVNSLHISKFWNWLLIIILGICLFLWNRTKTEKDYNSKEEFDIAYEEFKVQREEAIQKVDRIAFSGQVPCNVLGANVGDYIIPIDDNGKIKGQAITNPTFEQYQISVGKVWKIMEDGRAWIAVKIG
jgi:hypothetical protein